MILFRVAAYLGRSVREVERAMPARELEEWAAYIARHPPTAEVVDFQLAELLALFHAAHRGSGTPATTAAEWSLYQRLRARTAQDIAAEESARLKRMFGVM